MNSFEAFKIFKRIEYIIKYRPGIKCEIQVIKGTDVLDNITYKLLETLDKEYVLDIEITKDKIDSPYFNCVYKVTYSTYTNLMKVYMYDSGSNSIIKLTREEVTSLEDIKKYIPYL